MSKTSWKQAIGTGDKLVRVEDFKWADPSDFGSNRTVILLHGFGSTGEYLLELGEYLQHFGFRALIYNYNSLKGIDDIARALEGILSQVERLSPGAITTNGFFFVAHSLGGLVARRLALQEPLSRSIRGIVMLGAPNNGCFPDEDILDYFIQYGQYLSGLTLVPSVACKTARELIKSDAPDTSLGLRLCAIDTLNDQWKEAKNLPPCITISGGRDRLEFSNNLITNWLANRAIQRRMAGEPNDGLVAESSVSLNATIYPEGRPGYTHLNSYAEYPQINHSHLKDNQSIALEIISWLNDIAKSP